MARRRKAQVPCRGIAWGGTTPVKNLMIRFNPEEDYVPVESFVQTKTIPDVLDPHMVAQGAGDALIRLAITDPGIRTRRLDSGYYVRTVEIVEV